MTCDYFLRVLRLVIFSAFLVACERSPEELAGAMIMTDDNEEFRFLAAEAIDLGEKSIPIFLAVLNRHVENTGNLTEWSKTNISVEYLRDLARQGIYSTEEVPTLLYVIEGQQIHIRDTLMTAETLQIITGLDVGYHEEFAKRYTGDDEPERLRKIAAWRDWYNKQAGIDAD